MTAQTTDLLLIERGGVLHKITAAELAALGGGGGGASIAQIIATIPYSLGGMATVNVVSAGVTPASKIIVSLAGTDENEPDDIDDWTVTATPLAGSIDFNISCQSPFGGDVVINYLIG